MTTAHPFTWSDRFLLGHHSIDATHVEFVECVEALLNADGAAIPGALDAFIRHAEAHFQQENDWLGAPDFPGGGECHIEEHEKVLNAAYDVRALVAQGELGVARAYARELADWFPGLADYMDSALATWLVKRSHNGRPLVFRRLETA